MTEFLCKSHYVKYTFPVVSIRSGEKLIGLLRLVSMFETILRILSLLGNII